MWDLVKKMEKNMPSLGACIVLINTVVANYSCVTYLQDFEGGGK